MRGGAERGGLVWLIILCPLFHVLAVSDDTVCCAVRLGTAMPRKSAAKKGLLDGSDEEKEPETLRVNDAFAKRFQARLSPASRACCARWRLLGALCRRCSGRSRRRRLFPVSDACAAQQGTRGAAPPAGKARPTRRRPSRAAHRVRAPASVRACFSFRGAGAAATRTRGRRRTARRRAAAATRRRRRLYRRWTSASSRRC